MLITVYNYFLSYDSPSMAVWYLKSEKTVTCDLD
jgi:hypothetical protein